MKTNYIDTERMKFVLWTSQKHNLTELQIRAETCFNMDLHRTKTMKCRWGQAATEMSKLKHPCFHMPVIKSHWKQCRRIRRTVIAVECIKMFLLAFLCLIYSIFFFCIAKLPRLMKHMNKYLQYNWANRSWTGIRKANLDFSVILPTVYSMTYRNVSSG